VTDLLGAAGAGDASERALAQGLAWAAGKRGREQASTGNALR
jgi:hypothetical protein